jgi:hypothetical protein
MKPPDLPAPTVAPPTADNISEMSTVMKPRYPRVKLDPQGRKFAKGFRSAIVLSGPRPLMRKARRPR